MRAARFRQKLMILWAEEAKSLKMHEIRDDMPDRPDLAARQVATRLRDFCCNAERWRDFGRAEVDSARELLVECLSFVTPEQQGSPVAGCGDQN
jgi:hypothetical protein